MKQILLISFLFSTCLCFSQSAETENILNAIINKAPVDSLELIVRKEFKKWNETHIQELSNYGEEHSEGVKFTLTFLLFKQNELDKCRDQINELLQLQWERQDYYGGLLNILGEVYYKRNDFGPAYKYFTKSLDIFNQIKGFESKKGKVIFNLANTCKKTGLLAKASSFYHQALACFKSTDNLTFMAGCFNGLGNCLTKLNQFDDALNYHKQALEIRENLDSKSQVASSYYNIGQTLKADKKYSQAIIQYSNAYDIWTQVNKKKWQMHAKACIGECYLSLGQLDIAKSHLFEVLLYVKEQNEPTGFAYLYNDIAECQIQSNELEGALEMSIKSLELAKSSEDYETSLIALDRTTQILSLQENFALAFEYNQERKILRDSLIAKTTAESIVQNEIRYQSQLKDDEIKFLAAKNRIKTLEADSLSRKKNIAYLALFLLMIILIVALLITRRIQSDSKIIKKDRDTIQLLHTELRHRTSNSLAVLRSLFNIEKGTQTNPELRSFSESAVHRINSLLTIHNLASKKEETEDIGEVNLKQYLDEFISNANLSMGSKVKIENEIPTIFIAYNKTVNIGLTLYELLMNVKKYADTSKSVSGRLTYVDQEIKLQLSNHIRQDINSTLPSTEMGAEIISLLVEQLDGTIETNTVNDVFNVELSVKI